MCIKRGVLCEYNSFQVFGASSSAGEGGGGDVVRLEEKPVGNRLWWFGPYSDWLRVVKMVNPLALSQEELFSFLNKFFVESNCLLNFPFVRSDRNPIMDPIKMLGPKYPVIQNVIYTVVSNALETQCKDSRWREVKDQFMDVSYGSLVRLISEENGFEEDVCTLFGVLLLLSERSTGYAPLWRTHLRGASGLLERHIDKTGYSNPEYPIAQAVETLYCVVRTWFSIVETAAVLTTTKGGSVSSPDTLIKALDDTPFVTRVPGLYFNGFNIAKGYGQDLVPLFSRTAVLVFQQKNNLLTHPEAVKSAKDILSDLETVNKQVFTFPDQFDDTWTKLLNCSHLLFCQSLRLSLLRNILQKDPKDLKDLLKEFLDVAETMPFAYCVSIGIHWPLFTAGLCALQIEHRAKIEEFLQSIIGRGIHVARVSLHRLHLWWESLDFDQDPLQTDVDSIVL
ncbi:hypothetical protein TRICI_000248 [Trichomonascus ciferrii]|uniref:Transcription factor domain-containing protein n=1 Tax=Trichomonascus ciferrii TaxID=44093 RepID=A0A642VDU2_9ASCO|nr:hypothetical protein TRICI_000248 [Trichomonascus ciferrii]